MSDELSQLAQEMEFAWSEFREELESGMAKYGEETAETKQYLDRLDNRMNAIELQMARVADSPGHTKTEHDEAFGTWLRKGLVAPEHKAFVLFDETLGGLFAPPEFIVELIQGVRESSPLRSYASIRQTSRTSVQMPKRTGVSAAKWVTETGARAAATGLTFGLEEIPVHEQSVYVDVSFADLEDSLFDIESYIRSNFADDFGILEATAFVKGDAVGKPEGFVTNADVGVVNSGNASALTADGLIDLKYALKDAYLASPQLRFLLNRDALKAIRKLKDTANNYLWATGFHGLAEGAEATIDGTPYALAADLDVVAANNKPVAIGAWNKGYMIIDRLALSIQRDPFTQAGNGLVRLTARRRVGGQTIIPEAIKIQKVSV